MEKSYKTLFINILLPAHMFTKFRLFAHILVCVCGDDVKRFNSASLCQNFPLSTPYMLIKNLYASQRADNLLS